MESDLADEVQAVLSVDADEFDRRVAEDAAVVKREVDEGTFDNPQGIVGLEYEFYAVGERGSAGSFTAGEERNSGLERVPRRLLEYVGFEKELGLHNAEMTTSPQPLNAHGLAAQGSEVRARLDAASGPMAAEGRRLVSDGMWTIPPAGETARDYLTDSVEIDGVRLATNMSESARYHAMANTRDATVVLEAPGVTLEADTVMPESLITSIQPHFQVPHARDLPEYFRYALRVAGPLLAVAVNSPFFPPDLYDEGVDPEYVLSEGLAEHRIGVFEGVLNTEAAAKVQFPHDVETVEEAIDRVVGDETAVPMPVETQGRFDDDFAHFRMKHGTFWRWVRPVFGGATRESANARIEFRPLPAQPTVADTIALQATFAGLLVSMVRDEHPVAWQDWEDAQANFYRAAKHGLDADLDWIDADGDERTATAALYDDLFSAARDGLEARGLTAAEAAAYVDPLEARVDAGETPASWKRAAARERLADGASFEDAVYGAQRAYVERQKETLLDGSFADWL